MSVRQETTRSAFTVIELAITVSVIVILIAFVLPSITTARRDADEARAVGALKSFLADLELFHNRFGRYPATGWAELHPAGYLQGFQQKNSFQLLNGAYTFTYIYYPTSALVVADPTVNSGIHRRFLCEIFGDFSYQGGAKRVSGVIYSQLGYGAPWVALP